MLGRFDAPHRKIHSTAAEVRALQARGSWERSLDVIERNRCTVLTTMMMLFDNLQELVRETQQEIAVVLQTDKRNLRRCGR